ncbi:flagellar assembly protein FliH [Pantoea sp. B65]|uniref:flagellar assembly protein FliH n=1 Tax=Pantoea sp. B65 TaxID=2813359 RepID=UPI0039B49F4A
MISKLKTEAGGTARLHQFPPLRHGWRAADAGSSHYQQQLMDGFQQGVSDGFEQGLQQGKDQGYQEGLRSGREEGLRLGREDGKRIAHTQFMLAAQPLDALIRQLQTTLNEHEQRRRAELLQLVEKVARQVIRCELALQPTQMLALVEESLLSLPEAPTRLRVLLNPEELLRISEIEPAKVAEWGLTAEAELESGECRVITESAEMDIGCHHRLEQCMDALTQNLSEAAGE